MHITPFIDHNHIEEHKILVPFVNSRITFAKTKANNIIWLIKNTGSVCLNSQRTFGQTKAYNIIGLT